jgi:hypothetical protein
MMILNDRWMPRMRTAISFSRHYRADHREHPTNQPDIAVFRPIADDHQPVQLLAARTIVV